VPFDDHEYPQIIPTPPYVAPGRPAPWADLEPAFVRGLSLERVEAALRRAGRHYEVADPPTSPAELAVMVADGGGAPLTRRSAVLAALFEEAGEARVILTRRSFALRNHRGEVALPGGRCDEGESAPRAALREAHEEIGLAPSQVRVIGWLSPIVTLASGSAIQPVVAVLAGRPSLRANPAEVERIFDVALADLAADGNFLEQRWRRETPRAGAAADGTFPIYFFRVPGEVIWGATGRVLTELLAVVTGTTDRLPGGPLA
jgi:8-oxo-dGTP pyrophosphatase MutT (NUDIX family)